MIQLMGRFIIGAMFWTKENQRRQRKRNTPNKKIRNMRLWYRAMDSEELDLDTESQAAADDNLGTGIMSPLQLD